MSHAAGVGPALSEEVVRGTMAVRLRDLAMGYAGIRPQTIDTLTAMLNADVYPYVPEKGSVGASGDLAPMSHLALVMIGLGEAFVDGRRVDGGTALDRAGLAPISLEAGEGLALINGTQVMAAMAALAVYDLTRLVKTADVACAMSLETLMGSNAEFNPLIHRVRPHPGQTTAADNMARITADSEIISSHKDCDRVQDAYTLRCSPQIHGASRQALNHVREVVTTEINSSTTNPLVIAETGEILFGGNFHGQPLALGADYLCMAAAELANVSERRIERLVNPNLSGLPAFLVRDSGLNSGFMIPQYTAAALVSENKVLAHPACVDSIPTSANKEDHVSMGAISVRKLRSIIDNLEYVLAIELLCGAQAVDLLTQGKPGRGTVKAYEAVREAVPSLDCDRIMSADLERARDLVRSGELVELVESAVGPLG
jgi:histidine ammonia-lyase